MTVIGHGTVSTYQNWGCRCVLCRWASQQRNRENRRRRDAREDIAWRAANGLPPIHGAGPPKPAATDTAWPNWLDDLWARRPHPK